VWKRGIVKLTDVEEAADEHDGVIGQHAQYTLLLHLIPQVLILPFLRTPPIRDLPLLRQLLLQITQQARHHLRQELCAQFNRTPSDQLVRHVQQHAPLVRAQRPRGAVHVARQHVRQLGEAVEMRLQTRHVAQHAIALLPYLAYSTPYRTRKPLVRELTRVDPLVEIIHALIADPRLPEAVCEDPLDDMLHLLWQLRPGRHVAEHVRVAEGLHEVGEEAGKGFGPEVLD
jgi:hypothetical protein